MKTHIRFSTIIVLIICVFALSSCSGGTEVEQEIPVPEKTAAPEEEIKVSPPPASPVLSPSPEPEPEPETVDVDWSGYFNGFNGSAVLYDGRQYTVFNSELAQTRRSPCSTFKIISSLIALENGILTPEDSTREWSGEVFWNEKWNRDIDFTDAFHESCVWYFRKLTDDIGPELIQEGLNQLQYGNCDISDWEGRLNNNNSNRALTGFWIESSLLISPKEQTEVMERIFGASSAYSAQTQESLKQVMLVTGQNASGVSIYGKTGMGKSYSVTVDAWFTGFAETAEERIYFCVYLGETDNMDVTSTAAKEIAIRLVSDYLDN